MPDLTTEKLLYFALAVLPGFVAMKTYSLWYPSPRKEWSLLLIDAITYSLLNFGLWFWWLVPLVDKGFQGNKLEMFAAFVVTCILSPVVFSYLSIICDKMAKESTRSIKK